MGTIVIEAGDSPAEIERKVGVGLAPLHAMRAAMERADLVEASAVVPGVTGPRPLVYDHTCGSYFWRESGALMSAPADRAGGFSAAEACEVDPYFCDDPDHLAKVELLLLTLEGMTYEALMPEKERTTNGRGGHHD